MKEGIFEVGDYVRVKSLEQLLSEYPVVNGTIRTPGFTFPRAMYHLCGKAFHISSIRKTTHKTTYLVSVEGVEHGSAYGIEQLWYITPGMVELVEDSMAHVTVDIASWEALL